jgi:DNA-directed RNA polymerase subunit RPC12/RpoP
MPRQLRKTIALVFVVACLGLSVWLLFVRQSGGVRFADSWNAVLLCAECGNKFKAKASLTSDVAAQICPKCGKKTAWEAKHCSKCNLDFVPKLAGEPPRPEAIPTCPRCGKSRYVSSVLPEGAVPPPPD